MATPKELGNIFKKAREERGINREEANLRSQIHSNVIKDIETGAYERLGKIYIKSFMKKYAAFLGLDAQDVLDKFESIYEEVPEQDVPPEKVEKERKGIRDLSKSGLVIDREKGFPIVMATAIAVVLIALVLVFAGRKGEETPARGEKPAVKPMAVRPVPEKKKAKAAEVAKETIAAVKPVAREKPAVKKTVSRPVVPKGEPVVLTLLARGEVWIKVFDDSGTVFVGTLKRRDVRTFKSSGPLTVWTGKGENLYFTVNRRDVGRVADGVVKNIQVSAKGIKAADKWVTRFD